ncbi:MAG: hypothetical protein ABIG39_07730 [Candidatus Micrarchaeota archaeon]
MSGILSLSTHCSPIRISLSGKDIMTLAATIKNASGEPRIVSVDLVLPSELGVDDVGVNTNKNIRLGEIPPGESREASFGIYATHRTNPAEYEAHLTAFAHYRNYDSVLEKVSLKTTIRVVE